MCEGNIRNCTEEFCSCPRPGRPSGAKGKAPSPSTSWSCPLQSRTGAQRRHNPFSLSSHHLPFLWLNKKKDCYFSAMKNQHLWYPWGLIPLIFLVNTTGNVPSIHVPPLMYFFNFFIAYFVSHKLKGQLHSMLIYCSQGKISPYVTTHCC